ncbi:MAG: 30S ribosomal protein S19 [Sweet potato little leaf phytoplasma]|uniref:Small ribosomal subunit protein uS19 n=4 Tax=Candidatus Phytoplasma TaxID=33926 RepID=A0A9K3WRH2_9MOLU|nr:MULTISPECIES: 30S ribosomal protein S19 [Phytoplasma]QLL36782.1 30S ribosomal protein S19 ['Echinacea purpurea' witches'-broom phytoplasma]WEX20549.1 MAG: 30S ribosomal protein S19 [Candidatus Phytoplasma aurantifolia]EMR14394.1 30S ribosomal protein S19 [Peanut witches'-broom phytoplasma NTU2011]MCG3566833.1 30S ribosomal protein S19 [Sesame phyllody phytoplasma]MDO8008792.1 30S ribosomal protein S19 [Sweet potato little leaf phytoplasma]
MSRSIKKGFFADHNLLSKVMRQEKQKIKKTIKTYSRDTSIIPEFVGHKIAVHNGKDFTDLFITEDMVGYKLGSFAFTRKHVVHAKKDKSSQKK